MASSGHVHPYAISSSERSSAWISDLGYLFSIGRSKTLSRPFPVAQSVTERSRCSARTDIPVSAPSRNVAMPLELHCLLNTFVPNSLTQNLVLDSPYACGKTGRFISSSPTRTPDRLLVISCLSHASTAQGLSPSQNQAHCQVR